MPDYTVALFRTVATRLAIARYPQQARDLCEEMLNQSRVSPTRAQAAWFAMADIYSRLHDRRMSLVAFACAVAGRRGEVPLTGFNEINLWARLLRDNGLFDFALEALDRSDAGLQASGAYENLRYQQEYLRLTIELAQLLRAESRREGKLLALVERASRSALDAQAHGEEGVQAAAMLAQIVLLCETDNIAVPEEARSTIKKLMGTPLSARPFLETLTGDGNPFSALWSMYRSSEEARYADDAALDSRHLTVAARDVLTRQVQKFGATDLLLPFDLLADSGVATPGWMVTSRPPRRFATPEEIQAVVDRLEFLGIALVMAAFNNRGELLSLRCSQGRVDLVHEVGFSWAAFQRWGKRYPYDYCNDLDAANCFIGKDQLMVDSMDQCQWVTLPQRPIVVVFDNDLRALPSNLIRTGFEFVGAKQPVAASPSLAWLAEAMERQPSRSPQLHAWISGAGDKGETLNVLIEYLRDTFDRYGVCFDTGNQPPTTLSGADLVFVAAHGQVSPDGRYFHTLNDEGSFKVPAEVVARALRNARVVVLFVCSGGRLDKVPGADTTSGLTKQLIGAGCSTVIASPWPMEATVAAQWAPVFLDRWTAGLTVIEACYEANRPITGDPSRSLAMHVYGDPTQRYS